MINIELPPPLTQSEQKELLKKLPDVEARETLICRNLRLVQYISKKYTVTNLEEDLFSIGVIGLIKAIDSYNIDKNILLVTYAARCIDNEILMYLRKNKKYISEISIDTPNLSYKDGNEIESLSEIIPDSKSTLFIESLEKEEVFFTVLNTVSNQVYEKSFKNFIIFLYMISGKKQREVAKKFGISQSYVSRIFTKLKKQCKNCNCNKIHKYTNIYFYKGEDNYLYLEIKGLPLIRKTLEKESFGEIADLL